MTIAACGARNCWRRLEAFDAELPERPQIAVPSRIVHMPLSWNDPATQLAQAKYMQAVRPDAPWCPDNIEFIRRINGLDSVDDVHRIVHEASYLVLGLGDVYLGAPVATPTDPRHRLVTTKYNPARTWTPENAVGIGGAYMCVYGMEGPGGYQLVGRTVQVWNTNRVTRTFVEGAAVGAALLRPDSLLSSLDRRTGRAAARHPARRLRSAHRRGGVQPGAPRGDARCRSDPGIAAFKERQTRAFNEERERWRINGQLDSGSRCWRCRSRNPETRSVPEGCEAVVAPMTASVFQVAAQPGQRVAEGESCWCSMQ